MRVVQALFVLFFIVFIVSCANIYVVQHDYDKQVNFANLNTYDWMTVPEETDIDSLLVERVRKAVNAELQAKGLMMTSNNPHFLIAENLRKKDKVIGNRGSRYGMAEGYWGPKDLSAHQFKEGSLILDFVDAESKKMIWRGVAKAQIDSANTPEKREKLINEAVHKILKNFPPAPSK